MIDARGADASTAEMVMAQLLQGIGSVSAIAMEVGAQASVTHADVAMVTAAALLTAEIGGAIGSAVGVCLYHLKFILLLNGWLVFSWYDVVEHAAG